MILFAHLLRQKSCLQSHRCHLIVSLLLIVVKVDPIERFASMVVVQVLQNLLLLFGVRNVLFYLSGFRLVFAGLGKHPVNNFAAGQDRTEVVSRGHPRLGNLDFFFQPINVVLWVEEVLCLLDHLVVVLF